MNITQMLLNQQQHRPEALAIRHGTTELTYGEFGCKVAETAAVLLEEGIHINDVVAVSLNDPLDHLTATLALAHMGATVFSIPRMMPIAKSQQLLRLTRCKGIIALKENSFPVGPNSPRIFSWSNLRKYESYRCIPPVTANTDKPWIYISGSGSTGRPKIMPITHAQEIARREATEHRLPFGADDIEHSLVSMSFYAAKYRALDDFSVGAAVCLSMPTHVTYRQWIEQGFITVLHATVFHIEQLLTTLPSDAKLVMANLQALMISGSSVSMRLRQEIFERLSTKLYVRWGANEFGIGTVTDKADVFSLAGSVGYPLKNFKVEIVNDTGKVLSAGIEGHIRVSSPTLIRGYLGDAEATKKAFRDGWFYPGDIGQLSSNGQLIHRCRADDMMIISGVNVYPIEVEECLRTHPGVKDVFVTSVPHRQLQDIPVALVVPDSGAMIDSTALLHYVQAQLGTHTLLDLILIERIPRSEQGKIQRISVTDIFFKKWAADKRQASPQKE